MSLNSQMRELAERLVAHEAKGAKPEEKANASLIVFEKLKPELTPLMGNVGYRALLARALAMTHGEGPWLKSVQVTATGGVVGLEQPNTATESEAIIEGITVMVTELLRLLTAFIGEELTTRLVGRVWSREVVHGDEKEGDAE